MLTVTFNNGTAFRNSSITFGTYGYCFFNALLNRPREHYCFGRRIGYSPANIIEAIYKTNFTASTVSTTNRPTHSMALYPAAFAFSLLTIIICFMGYQVFPFIFGIVTWVLCLIAMSMIKAAADEDSLDLHASFGKAIWLVVAATITGLAGVTGLTTYSPQNDGAS